MSLGRILPGRSHRAPDAFGTLKRLVFTHHKCASHWIWLVFEQLCRRIDYSIGNLDTFAHGRTENDATRAEVEAEYRVAIGSDLLVDANARSCNLTLLDALVDDYRAIHVVRDPRDLLVSAYYSHRAVHPTVTWPALARHRRSLQEVDIEAGLLLELEFSAFALDSLAGWDWSHPRVRTIRYEELFPQPLRELARACAWLDLPVTNLDLVEVGQELAFERLSGGRRPGTEDRSHHFRLGMSGDWKSHFTPRVEAAFVERYADLLEAAGYTDA